MCNTRLFLRFLRPVIYYFLFLFLLFSANPPVPREATASPSISRMLVGSPVLAVLLVLVLPEEVVVLLPVPEVVVLFFDAAGVVVGVVVVVRALLRPRVAIDYKNEFAPEEKKK